MKNNFRKLIVIFGLSFFCSTNCAKRKNQGLYDIRIHECVKNFRGGSYKNEHLVQCVKDLTLMKNQGLKIAPHKMAKRVNNEVRKTTELLALTKRPRKGFLPGADGFFQKSRLSIYFRALLNAIWDDLKGDDAKMLKSIKLAVDKSPNRRLKRDFESKWIKLFESAAKDSTSEKNESVKQVDKDIESLSFVISSYNKLKESINSCIAGLNNQLITTEMEKNNFSKKCAAIKIEKEGKSKGIISFLFVDFLNKILEIAKREEAGELGNAHFKSALSDLFLNVYKELNKINEEAAQKFVKNAKTGSIKNLIIKSNLESWQKVRSA